MTNNENTVRERLRLIFEANKKNASSRKIQRGTGIGRMTVIRALEGTRSFTHEEIDALCDFFGIDQHQLDGTKFRKRSNELKSLTKNKCYLKALEVAGDLEFIAVTQQEKAYARLRVGEALLNLENYKEAKKAIVKGIALAEEIMSFDDVENGRHMLLRLSLILEDYTAMKKEATTWLKTSNSNFRDSHIAKLYHYIGMAYYYLGDKVLARDFYTKSINLFEKLDSDVDSRLDIARLKATIADMDYHEGDYKVSLSRYKEALEIQLELNDDIKYILTTKKDIVRCLFILGRKDESLSLAEQTISEIDLQGANFSDIRGKILLVKIEITNNVELCKEILSSNHGCIELAVNVADKVVRHSFKGGGFEANTVEMCYDIVRDYEGKITELKWGVWY